MMKLSYTCIAVLAALSACVAVADDQTANMKKQVADEYHFTITCDPKKDLYEIVPETIRNVEAPKHRITLNGKDVTQDVFTHQCKLANEIVIETRVDLTKPTIAQKGNRYSAPPQCTCYLPII